MGLHACFNLSKILCQDVNADKTEIYWSQNKRPDRDLYTLHKKPKIVLFNSFQFKLNC